MHTDFYASLHRHGKDKLLLQKLLARPDSAELLSLFEAFYDQYCTLSSSQACCLIPKKIHQVWLGSDVPSHYATLVQTWARAKGWTYQLWTEPDVEKIVLHNKELYQRSQNYGEKSDILRLEILYQEGGLYVDVDTQCLNIDFFANLHHTLTFYAGFEPLAHRWIGISNAVMGSQAGHPVLHKMIQELKGHYLAHEREWAVVKTGPKFVTNVIADMAQESQLAKACIFPSSYFSPASYNDIQQQNYRVFNESAVLHHWSGSWIAK